MSAYLAVPTQHFTVADIRASDRSDLGMAYVWLGGTAVKVADAATARALALAFAQAEDMLTAQAAVRAPQPEKDAP